MATTKKTTAKTKLVNDTAPAQLNSKHRYIVIASFNGQINNTKFRGNTGDIIEMEPWQANLLKTYVVEE